MLTTPTYLANGLPFVCTGAICLKRACKQIIKTPPRLQKIYLDSLWLYRILLKKSETRKYILQVSDNVNYDYMLYSLRIDITP